ncbi:MAG: hypothetical protein DHS20C14_16830 [Phycisphaeraceae bacterium]|nr:MAG: hypothetical protein DHS20C14_16830 [Phycisphaeraceae bacterium]
MRSLLTAVAFALVAAPAVAQWDPFNADWGKSDETDLRVMTWNVQDGICRTNSKADAFDNWNGIVRIIASLQPDVLILQECADNSGNGTGSGADSVAQLTDVCELLFHGGADPYAGGTVGSYVQLFVPAYDLPYIFVTPSSDGFNRNVILSRYPFADLNGNGTSQLGDFFQLPDATAWDHGLNGGIRGFMHAEIDLPDSVYAGDVIVGNSHLKAGGSSSDQADRLDAAKAIAYYIQYYFNGNQSGNDDPNDVVINPADGTLTDPNTPVIWGGDWNNNPSSKGPVEWMVQAQFSGGTSDGTDRDGTDCLRDFAVHPTTGSTTTQGSSKLDYLAWQDSIATARRQFLFNSSGMQTADIPFPADGFPVNAGLISSFAADHRPVVVDFILPLAPQCFCDCDGNGMLNIDDVDCFVAGFVGGDLGVADCDGSGGLNIDDVDCFVACFIATCP